LGFCRSEARNEAETRILKTRSKAPADKVVKAIRGRTRRHFSAGARIRIVLEGLCGAVPARGYCPEPVLQLVEGVEAGKQACWRYWPCGDHGRGEGSSAGCIYPPCSMITRVISSPESCVPPCGHSRHRDVGHGAHRLGLRPCQCSSPACYRITVPAISLAIWPGISMTKAGIMRAARPSTPKPGGS